MVFDELHRGHHLADALTGEVLEVAGFEDRHHALLDILAEDLLLVRRVHLGQRARRLIDEFGGLQDLLRGLFGPADHGTEFAIDLGHLLAIEALAVQHRDLALGAVDRVVNEIELDLELFALLDLGAVGFDHRQCFGALARDLILDRCGDGAVGDDRAGARHLGADCAQLGHDLTVHGADVAVHRPRCHHVGDGFFDTKTLAMNRHQDIPHLHSIPVLARRGLISRSRGNWRSGTWS